MTKLRAAMAVGTIAMSLAVRGAADVGAEPIRIAQNATPNADNSQKNVRDRNDQTLTSGDQGTSKSDVAITQHIRKAVVADDNLSVNAKNVKIITRDGVVTLRGPVKTGKEKTQIAAMAAKASGVKRVDDQIEIEAKR